MGAAFERVISLQLEQFSPEEAKRRHIAIARAGLAEFMARQNAKPQVQIEVDGHVAANENSVKPFGVIAYRFMRMRELCAFALAQAEALSPVRSGRFKKSWFFLVDNRETTLAALPEGQVVILTNDQPQARKINTGSKGFEKYAPPGVVEKVRQLVIKRYGKIVDVEIEYITLQDGYVLKGYQKTALAQLNRRSSVFRAHGTHLARRQDAIRGASMTYPALVITPRRFV